MTGAGRRLWIDAHVHIHGHAEDGGPRDFPIAEILRVLDADPAQLVWITSLSLPEMDLVRNDPAGRLLGVNEGQWQLVQEAPPGRLFGSVVVHPGALRESHRALDLYGGERGFVQVGEIMAHVWGFTHDHPGMLELARHAAELGLPLQCHCSTNDVADGEHLRQALSLARQVPEAQIVAGHALGGSNTYRHLDAAEAYFAEGGENLWLEVRDFNQLPYVRASLEHVGPARLVVGTDWISWYPPPFPPYGMIWPESDPGRIPYPCCVASLEGFLREAGADDAAVETIAAGNALDLYRLRGRLGG